MTQQQLDYLAINQQCSIALRAADLTAMIRTGDVSSNAKAANVMASWSLMRAIKDFEVASEELTDEEMFTAQEKLIALESANESYY